MHGSRELAGYVEQGDGVMIAAHPYRRQMPWFSRNDDEYQLALDKAARNPAYQYVTALETLNGRGSDKENEFSRRLQEMMKLPATAGTDSHAISDIGKVATYFDREIRDERELIAELKAGRYHPVDLRTGKPLGERGSL
jgi:hypothetical protein